MGVLTSSLTTSGAAPGYEVTTTSWGKLTDGISSCFSDVRARLPNTATTIVTRAIRARFRRLKTERKCTVLPGMVGVRRPVFQASAIVLNDLVSPALNMTRRIAQLLVGLLFFGLGIALMVQAELGIPPWDVLVQGLQLKTGLPFGVLVIATSIVVLLVWIPIRQRPGIGTLANALLVGIFVEVGFAIFPTPTDLLWSIVSFAFGLVLVGF